MRTEIPTCVIEGCNRYAAYEVAKDVRVRFVCRRCATEMVALFGWKLT